MLQVSTWTRLLVALILLTGLFVAVPNALPDDIRARIPGWLPSQTVTLGLDLQGGSYLLLEVELDAVQKDKLESLMGDVRRALRKAHIRYDNIGVNGDTFSVEIKDPTQRDDARTLIEGLNPTMGTGVLGVSGKAYEFSDNGQGTYSMKITDQYKTQTQAEIVNQSIEVVRRRIDALGTREPTIERQGDNRILVQVPGLKDPQHLKDTLGKTAKMTFQLVDEAADRAGAATSGIAPIGDEILPVQNKDPKAIPQRIVVEKRVMVAGDRLVDASDGFDQRTGEPTVNFRFDSVGAREFADVTKAYPPQTQRFAIVLDNQVISAPVINEPILGGSGQISGSFTPQSAHDLAALLRAGALPAPLKVIEERTVGAELGADSVRAGRYSALAGLVLVALFMIARYGLFGLFADIALTLNIVLLLAVLTLFGATLTLPGIAGIVLTMGMAVDANVLIYERIREEQRNGRSMLASIDQGFRRAMSTIIDANSTHVIAALILFQLGSGPVRGFAVTLGVGIITSFFTAVMVTRLIVILWLNIRRPRTLAI
ncbi:MAG TPA: protein translocase subunit SecD [Rhizomicrobium sp.]|nr:protein translocase subunit SecD [Rhizomicrobium sp.]